jgi:hypothetical protein
LLSHGGRATYIGIGTGDATIHFDANVFHTRKLQLRASYASPAMYFPAVLAFLIGPDKAATLRSVGIGLLLLAGALMIVGYVIPSYIVPNATSSPWVEIVPQIAHDNLTLLGGICLVVLGSGLAALTAAAAATRR